MHIHQTIVCPICHIFTAKTSTSCASYCTMHTGIGLQMVMRYGICYLQKFWKWQYITIHVINLCCCIPDALSWVPMHWSTDPCITCRLYKYVCIHVWLDPHTLKLSRMLTILVSVILVVSVSPTLNFIFSVCECECVCVCVCVCVCACAIISLWYVM